jgi:HEAT repeat protein
MAKSRGVDAKLNRLRVLSREPAADGHRAELRQALGDKSNLVVAAAAEIVGERQLADLASDLVATFHRFLVEPEETDKLCRAKIAILEALNKIDHDKEEVFRIGLRHVQNEPRWGGADDTAAPLRGTAAFGLVRIYPPDVIVLLADLLADPEKAARSAAVQALGASRAPAAIPLLRFKARIGDGEPEVMADCLTALMTADPKESLSLVAQFLAHPSEAVAEGAALALGESRRPDALEVLKMHWPEAQHGSRQQVLPLAIAMTRLPAALDFLLEILAGDSQTAAAAALAALAIHRHNQSVKERIATILEKKGVAALQESFAKKFMAQE